ncbi:MAG TPA: tetratricopeptide repeat protein [Pyrinomonadaceae bacterium]|nr:tetratricopeptide repeat protein [Pyrinomonadaceae bacterium]
MFKAILKKEILFLIGVLCIAPLVSYGQIVGGDLGSSSGLFKGKGKPKAASTTSSAPKKAAAKKSAPKAKNTTPKNTTAVKPAAKNTGGAPTVARNTNRNISRSTAASTDPNAEELFEQALEEGNTARDNRNYNGAEKSYHRAQSFKPRDSRAVYGLGNLYSDQQRWEEAEKAYREAIALDPDVPETYIALSFVLTQPIAGANVADRYVEAETAAHKAIGIDRSSGIAYDQLGTALELQGKIGPETEYAYQRAIQLLPGYALPYAHLGRLKGRNNQQAEAQKAFQTAIQLAKDVPSMILVADTLQVSRSADSERLLRQALQLDPRNPTALFLLSDVLRRQQKLAEAEKVLRESLQISQNSYTPHSKLGDLFLQLRRFNEAEASFIRALDSASPAEKVKLAGLQGFTGVGDGYMKDRKFKDAVRAYNRAKQIDPKNTDIQAKITAVEKLAF